MSFSDVLPYEWAANVEAKGCDVKRFGWAVLLVAGCALVALGSAPVLYFEGLVWTQAKVPQVEPRPDRARGHWVDDYFLVESLDDHTFAIGELRRRN